MTALRCERKLARPGERKREAGVALAMAVERHAHKPEPVAVVGWL